MTEAEKNDINQTIFGPEFVPILRNYSTLRTFKYMNLTWDENYAVPTAFTLTNNGFGFSFNIAPCDEMFDMNR